MGYGEQWFTMADSLKEPLDEKLRDDYLVAFVHPETRIVPAESIYRQWNEGEKAELPIARQKGYLLSDRALHMKALLNNYGLEIPPEMAYTPDHLIIQLEFLGFLLENHKYVEARTFVEEHLKWLSDLLHTAEQKLPKDNFYLKKISEIQETLDSYVMPCSDS